MWTQETEDVGVCIISEQLTHWLDSCLAMKDNVIKTTIQLLRYDNASFFFGVPLKLFYNLMRTTVVLLFPDRTSPCKHPGIKFTF